MEVKEQHPLKQGLKLGNFFLVWLTARGVKEQHPLKQGLKPPSRADDALIQEVELKNNIH